MPETTLIALLLAGRLLAPAPAPVDVNVAINVAPQILAVVSPSRLVAVPGSSVFYALSASPTLFVYHGRYYSFSRGSWFRSAGPGNSWSLIATAEVPTPCSPRRWRCSPTPPRRRPQRRPHLDRASAAQRSAVASAAAARAADDPTDEPSEVGEEVHGRSHEALSSEFDH